MTRVADILAIKGSGVCEIAPEATVYEAIQKMVQANVGSLVVGTGGALAGIFTERDHLRRVTLEDRDPRTTPVRQVMTERVICVEREMSIRDCMAIMTRERIRHLPVLEGGRVVGVISIGDLVKHMSKEQEIEIRCLTDYVSGRT